MIFMKLKFPKSLCLKFRIFSGKQLSRKLSTLENGAEPIYAATADLVRSELPDLEAAPITLALGETLAASGAETLQTLRSLLEETRLQD